MNIKETHMQIFHDPRSHDPDPGQEKSTEKSFFDTSVGIM